MAIHETITLGSAVDIPGPPTALRVVDGHGYDHPARDTQLVALACALGAADCGGKLSRNERSLIAAARQEKAVPTAVIDTTRAAIQRGCDPLGEVFYRLRPADVRRATGTFYTPPPIVSSMVAWLLGHDVARVVDPGCGSGRFAVAVARARPDIPLVAIDADPLATILTRGALAALGVRNARILHHDYLTVTLPRVTGATGYIANPPYVRHHGLSATTKAWAAAAAARVGIPVSGLSGLHSLFFLATALHARPGDVGCFITSAEWLDTQYGGTIRRLLTEQLGVQGLTMIDPEVTTFEDVMTTALITQFAVRSPVTSVSLRCTASASDIDLMLRSDETVCLAQMKASARWGPLMRKTPAHAAGAEGEPDVPLSAYARVHRGIATGANDYFVLSRARAANLGLLPWCRPVITNAKEILTSGGVIRDTPERQVILIPPRTIDRVAHPALDAYLVRGEEAQGGTPPIAGRYLPSHRSPWWYLGPAIAPAIVASYMARQAPVFAHNPDGLLLLNIGHGLYPHRPLSPAQLQAFTEHLNAHRGSLQGQGRTYHGGLEKFEPREMEAIRIRVVE